MRILIVGGGPSGLKCAFNLLQAGHEVQLFEREPVLGGLARSFELDGAKIERYYHFICSNDAGLLTAIKELGLESQLKWKYTKMGIWREGKIYPTATVLDILRLAVLPPSARLKFLWGSFMASQRKSWENLENLPAIEWLHREFGESVYRVMWEPLMGHKFGPYANEVSAAWIWARIKRLAESKTRVLKLERLGYLIGGSEVVFTELAARVRAKGAAIHTGAHIERILVRNNQAYGLYVNGTEISGDVVISTVPLPRLVQLLPEGADQYRKYLQQTKSLGVVCVFLRMKKSLSPYFWMNVSGVDILFPGIIEYTNLNPRPDINGHIAYIPNYLPRDHPYFTMEDGIVLEAYRNELRRMFPHFDSSVIRDAFVFRDLYAQPICETGFTRMMVPHKSPIQRLYITESSQLHPDDRNVSRTFELANHVTKIIQTARVDVSAEGIG